jgi:hypothetical protein
MFIACSIEQNTLVEIVLQQCTHSRGFSGRQQVCPEVLCANRIGLCLLVGFSLVILHGVNQIFARAVYVDGQTVVIEPKPSKK